MSTTKSVSTDETYVIEEPIEGDGSLTVRETTTDTVYHVVDYADSIVQEKLAARPVGSTVRLELAPADPDGLDWVVTRIKPGAPLAL
jgi:hypothetical protein